MPRKEIGTTLELINGQLRSYTTLGGYPVFYLDACDNVVCSECATESHLNDEEIDSFKIVGYAINYESEMYCDRCSIKIESAYGEDEPDDSNDYEIYEQETTQDYLINMLPDNDF